MTLYNYSKYRSITFALHPIEDHDMIDNFLAGGGGGDTGHYGFAIECGNH